MSGEELYELFKTLIGDEDFDKTQAYIFMNNAKNWVENTYKLAILEAVDTSKTASPGDTYLTMKDLPDDWRSTKKIVVGTMSQYFQVPFNRREAFRASSRRFYIDYKNEQFALCGKVGTAQVINHYYMVKTPDIEEATEDNVVVVWPDEFHPLIAFRAAKVYGGGIDADEIAFRMSDENELEYRNLLEAFIAWDQEIKLAAMNNERGYADDELPDSFDLGQQ